jgi:hypothetical protein
VELMLSRRVGPGEMDYVAHRRELRCLLFHQTLMKRYRRQNRSED